MSAIQSVGGNGSVVLTVLLKAVLGHPRLLVSPLERNGKMGASVPLKSLREKCLPNCSSGRS